MNSVSKSFLRFSLNEVTPAVNLPLVAKTPVANNDNNILLPIPKRKKTFFSVTTGVVDTGGAPMSNKYSKWPCNSTYNQDSEEDDS